MIPHVFAYQRERMAYQNSSSNPYIVVQWCNNEDKAMKNRHSLKTNILMEKMKKYTICLKFYSDLERCVGCHGNHISVSPSPAGERGEQERSGESLRGGERESQQDCGRVEGERER